MTLSGCCIYIECRCDELLQTLPPSRQIASAQSFIQTSAAIRNTRCKESFTGGLKPSRLWRNRTPHPFLPPLGNSLEGCWWGIALVPRFRGGCCYVSILAETKAPCQTLTKTTLLWTIVAISSQSCVIVMMYLSGIASVEISSSKSDQR